jgi:sugar phosphate isomerase/epimerase
MRLRRPDGRQVHLSYCTNVHPAEDLPGIIGQLDTYAVPVRERLAADVLGLGLWLAAPVAAALADDGGARRLLRRELDARGLEVVTLNGFPYEAFQAPVVKHAVYRPDWTTTARLDYTLDLARVLVDLLPDDAERGSVSTLPLAWREPWPQAQRDAARHMLDRLAGGLAEIAWQTGRVVRVAFEPEPGCVAETTGQAVDMLAGTDTDRLGVCLDLAHLACAWEDPKGAVDRLAAAGIPVVKVQVSAALEVADPVAARPVLEQYAEPRFLHQTRSAAGHACDDLDIALAENPPGPWRIHFHVPLHVPPAPPLTATTPQLTVVDCDHFDVETYTWDVLPAGQRPTSPAELADGIAGELAWTRDQLTGVQ